MTPVLVAPLNVLNICLSLAKLTKSNLSKNSCYYLMFKIIYLNNNTIHVK